jgi:hypothetical protein
MAASSTPPRYMVSATKEPVLVPWKKMITTTWTITRQIATTSNFGIRDIIHDQL